MFCDECGSELAEGSRFCEKCGHVLETSMPATAVASSAGPLDAEARKKRTIFIVAGALLLVIVWALVATSSRGRGSNANAAPAQQSASPTVERSLALPVIDSSFPVREEYYRYYEFSVPASSTNVRLEGRFQASGGPGDVEVFLFDQEGFVDWSNGHKSEPIYSSGRVTQSTIQLTLPAEQKTYCLVFNNRFSLYIPKTVSAHVTLHYDSAL